MVWIDIIKIYYQACGLNISISYNYELHICVHLKTRFHIEIQYTTPIDLHESFSFLLATSQNLEKILLLMSSLRISSSMVDREKEIINSTRDPRDKNRESIKWFCSSERKERKREKSYSPYRITIYMMIVQRTRFSTLM